MKRTICIAMLFAVFVGFHGLGAAAYGQSDVDKVALLIAEMNQAIMVDNIDAAFRYAEQMPDEWKEVFMQTVFLHSLRLNRCDIAKKSHSQMVEILRAIHKVPLSQHCP